MFASQDKKEVSVTLKLKGLPKGKGGVMYAGKYGEDNVGIHYPQSLLRDIGDGEFPKVVVMKMSAN